MKADWQESEGSSERKTQDVFRERGFQMTFGGSDKIRGTETDFYHNMFCPLSSSSSCFLISILACLVCLLCSLSFAPLDFSLSCFCLPLNISSPSVISLAPCHLTSPFSDSPSLHFDLFSFIFPLSYLYSFQTNFPPCVSASHFFCFFVPPWPLKSFPLFYCPSL